MSVEITYTKQVGEFTIGNDTFYVYLDNPSAEYSYGISANAIIYKNIHNNWGDYLGYVRYQPATESDTILEKCKQFIEKPKHKRGWWGGRKTRGRKSRRRKPTRHRRR